MYESNNHYLQIGLNIYSIGVYHCNDKMPFEQFFNYN